MIAIGFILGLLFSYSFSMYKQAKLDMKVFEDGLSKGIHLAGMAHTQILHHHDKNACYAKLYVHTEFSYPPKEMLK